MSKDLSDLEQACKERYEALKRYNQIYALGQKLGFTEKRKAAMNQAFREHLEAEWKMQREMERQFGDGKRLPIPIVNSVKPGG